MKEKINNLKYVVKRNIQSVTKFDFTSMDIQEAGQWPFAIKALFISVVCAGLLYFGNSLHVSKKNQELNVIENQETTLLDEIAVKSYVEPTLYDYKRQLEILKSDLQEISQQLPEKIEMSSILDEMTLLASSNNVMISQITLEQEEEQANYIELPFKISAKGKFHNFAAFLAELSRMNRIVTVHNVGILPEDDSSLLSLELVAKTYKYKNVLEEVESDE